MRFVDGETVCEKLFAFLKCEKGVTGEALADAILLLIHVQNITKYVYKRCASHRLKVCIVKCCSIKEVHNMMHTADSVSYFFSNSPKRQLVLGKWISDVLSEEKRKMKELCQTRWVKHHNALEVFLYLILPTVSCLEEIAHS